MKNAIFGLAVLGLAWGAVDVCPAQEEAPVREAARFLDILQPGQRVQIGQIGNSPVTGGLVVTLFTEEQWVEVERAAPERRAKLESLENLTHSLLRDSERRDVEAFGDGPNNGRSPDRSGDVWDQHQRATEEIAQIRRQLSGFGQIKQVGEDYIAVESASRISYYPASRILKIEQSKSVASPPSAEEATERPETAPSGQSAPAEPTPAPSEPTPANDGPQE